MDALIIYEDDKVSNLYPLTLTRPVFELRCGIFTLREKLIRRLLKLGKTKKKVYWSKKDFEIWLHNRPYLSGLFPNQTVDWKNLKDRYRQVILINGRALIDMDFLRDFDPSWEGRYVCRGTTVVANISSSRIAKLNLDQALISDEFLADLNESEIEANLITYPWDLIKLNGQEINLDFDLAPHREPGTKLPRSAHLLAKQRISIGKNAEIGAGVVIDAREGAVNIGEDTIIMANACLKGPLHIGRNTIIKMGACIYGETSIGDVCKVGGEVAESIIQGYSNKQHEGFLGHSYLGSWVNIGAGSNTSDMKNNYSTVRLRIHGKDVDSGEIFVGLFMGDHSKCGIGTVFNTGTIVGVCCNIFGAGYPPKYIPSFCWGGSGGFQEYNLDKALAVARRAMQRRSQDLTDSEAHILRTVFQITSKERSQFLYGSC